MNKFVEKKLEFYPVPFSTKTCWKHFAKYHFGFVRGYFDGDEFHILPSGVIAVVGRRSIDIRYCSTKHSPQSLIFKYMRRGFAFTLNLIEWQSLSKFPED